MLLLQMCQQVCKHPVAVCGGDHRLERDGHLRLPHQVQQGVYVLIAEVCQHQRRGIGARLQYQCSGGFYLHLAQQLGNGLAGIGGGNTAPAVILSQNDRAVVLYRGGQTTRRAVETALERHSIRTVEALIDLRMDPQEPCTLRAEQIVRAARLAANTTQTLRTDTASLEVLRTQTGCAVRFTIEGQSFVTLSGTVRFAQPLEVDWLLASMARPDGVRYQSLLTRSTDYRWMDEDGGGNST